MQPDFIHEFVRGKSELTLLLLHGTGGNERDLIPLGHELDPNASLLSPRGKVSENGMSRFFPSLAEFVSYFEDLQKHTHELTDFVAAAAQRYLIDMKQIVVCSYCYSTTTVATTLSLPPAS